MEEMLKLENHYFATIMVNIKSGKNDDKWVLNLGGNFDEKQNTVWFQNAFLVVVKGKKSTYWKISQNFEEEHHNYHCYWRTDELYVSAD